MSENHHDELVRITSLDDHKIPAHEIPCGCKRKIEIKEYACNINIFKRILSIFKIQHKVNSLFLHAKLAITQFP